MGTLQGRWVSWENSFFRETVGTRVGWGGGVLTMYEQGYDPSVAYERGQAQGCDPMGIIEGPMWVLDPPGGYPGKTRFLGETLGESV